MSTSLYAYYNRKIGVDVGVNAVGLCMTMGMQLQNICHTFFLIRKPFFSSSSVFFGNP